MKFVVYGVLLTMGIFSAAGCASTKVERVDVNKTIDLSGRWNDTDASMVAKTMIEDSLSRPWITQYMKEKGKEPTLIVGTINNRTDEHIDSLVFIKALEREMLNSGKVQFVASPEEREQVRDERRDQQRGFTDPETIKPFAKEYGADYMLIGNIDSITDAVKGKAVKFYQVNMELIDLTTNKKVWIGQQQIKKSIKNPQFSL